MVKASIQCKVTLRQISFKATLQALKQWEFIAATTKNLKQLFTEFIDLIGQCNLFIRQGRSEPRAIKRRPKPYQLLTAPRHQMVVSQSKRRKHAKSP